MIDAESRFLKSARRAAVDRLFRVFLLLTLFVSLFAVGHARAAEIHAFSSSFDTTGVTIPSAVAFDEESDSVYVLDFIDGSISRFTSAGAPSNFEALGTNTIAPPCGAECGQIAVDNSGGPNQGVLYVGNSTSFGPGRKVYAYLPTGRAAEGVRTQISVLEQGRFCGVATDPQQHLYIGHNAGVDFEQTNPDPVGAAYIQRFKPGLWLPSEVSPKPQVWPSLGAMYSMPYRQNGVFEDSCRIGATSDGDVYFSAYKAGFQGLTELTPTARASREFFDALPGPPSIIVDEGSNAFAVDQSSDDTYFVHGGFGNSTIVRRNDAGEQLESFGSPLYFSSGAAVDSTSGSVYVSNVVLNASFEIVKSEIQVYGPTVGPDISYGDVDVGATGAILSGSIGTASAGDVTDCKVEYGTSDGYGSTQQCTPDAAGTPFTGETPVSASLTGLSKETTYHYRFVASNANGTSQGQDRTFTTHNVKSLSTDPAEAVETTGATLKGSWVGDGSPTTYYFQWGPTTVYGFESSPSQPSTTTGPVEVSEPVTGLLPDTGDKGLYHFRIVATNAEGTTVGPDRTFRTKVNDPPLVTDTATGSVTANSAEVSAMVNPNSASTFFQVEFGPTHTYGSHTPASEPIDDDDTFHAVTETLGGLAPGMTYHYRVIATNFGGTTFGPDATFTTAAAPQPPASPPAPSTSNQPATGLSQPTSTDEKPKKCKRGFVKRKGKCVKKKAKKRKRKNRRSHSHG